GDDGRHGARHVGDLRDDQAAGGGRPFGAGDLDFEIDLLALNAVGPEALGRNPRLEGVGTVHLAGRAVDVDAAARGQARLGNHQANRRGAGETKAVVQDNRPFVSRWAMPPAYEISLPAATEGSAPVKATGCARSLAIPIFCRRRPLAGSGCSRSRSLAL